MSETAPQGGPPVPSGDLEIVISELHPPPPLMIDYYRNNLRLAEDKIAQLEADHATLLEEKGRAARHAQTLADAATFHSLLADKFLAKARQADAILVAYRVLTAAIEINHVALAGRARKIVARLTVAGGLYHPMPEDPDRLCEILDALEAAPPNPAACGGGFPENP